MKLKARLEKLEHKQQGPWSIELWLYPLEGNTVTGPDGKSYTLEEAEAIKAANPADIAIDHRRKPREP